MNKVFICFCVALACFLSGCQEQNEKISDPNKRAVLDDMKNLAGVWKQENGPIQIKISEKGEIISAIIPFGEVEVKPNSKTIVKMQDGSESIYESGDFILSFNKDNNEMFVELGMRHIDVHFQKERIEGNCKYILAGSLLDERIWMPDFYEYINFGPRFPQDPNEVFPTPTRFIKETTK